MARNRGFRQRISASLNMLVSRDKPVLNSVRSDRAMRTPGEELPLSAIGIDFRYSLREGLLFDKFNLSVKPSECTCILGPSGIGKSTLLHILAGFLKPLSGSVHLGDSIISEPTRSIGVVFQHFALFEWLTASQNIAFPMRLLGRSEEDANRQILKLMERFGLVEAANKRVWELSGGMQQRVALARALAAEPAYLLLDEPFSSLDCMNRASLRKLIAEIVSLDKVGFVIVTHDIDEAIRCGSRIILVGGTPLRIVREIAGVPDLLSGTSSLSPQQMEALVQQRQEIEQELTFMGVD
jgi:ABC-type nitrate/sulfonate/bicarbonate transport system ATPase subunit